MRGARSIRQRHGLPDLRDLDPSLASVPRWEVVLSLAVPWACLLIYILAASQGWWPVAVFGVMALSFFTYGSISHDLVHENLRLSRRLNDTLLCISELLAVRTGHAYQALVTSYVPHAPHADAPLQQTRLFRGRLLSLIAIEHLYHLEHHLYPQVPHHRWAELARRLDPYLQRAGVEAIEPCRREGHANDVKTDG